MAKFKVGDKVTALGRAGEIIYGPAESTFGCPTAYGVTVDGGDWVFPESDLVARAEFEEGDRVTVLHADGVHAIAAGPFRGLHGDNFYVYAEEVDEGEDATHSVAYVSALRPVDPEPTTNIKVGDRVRVLKAPGAERCHGRAGTVLSVTGPHPDDLHAHTVEMDSDGDTVCATKVERVADIKVGDRVRVLRAKWVEEQHGKIGTVLSVTETFRAESDDLHPYDIGLDDGGTIYVAEVEPVPATVTYAGVEYDLTVEYRDSEGDFWKFAKEPTEEGGNARLHYRDKFSGSYTTGTDALSQVVDAYGPLTEI